MYGNKIFVPVIVGPTAAGKSKLAVTLAKSFGGEIVNADSMQVYHGMEIATAQPSEEEKDGVPHRLMGFLEPTEKFSVCDYSALANNVISDIHGAGKLAFVVGGTGLYVNSLIDGIKFADTAESPDFRKEMRDFAERNGNAALWKRLRDADPVTAAELHENNLNRVIRALEVFHINGRKMSDLKRESRMTESNYEPLFIGLNYSERTELYSAIDSRVDRMIESGLVAEAKLFFEKYGNNELLTSAQAIGHKELRPYIKGKETLRESVVKLKQATRHYAKRQLTWFGKDKRIMWFSIKKTSDLYKIFSICYNIIKNSRNLS